MAAFPPPALGAGGLTLAGHLGAPAQLSTFLDYYTDATQDECNQQYKNVMPVFVSVHRCSTRPQAVLQ